MVAYELRFLVHMIHIGRIFEHVKFIGLQLMNRKWLFKLICKNMKNKMIFLLLFSIQLSFKQPICPRKL